MNQRVVWVGVIFVVLGGVLFFGQANHGDGAVPEKINSGEYRAYWLSRLQHIGARDAYEEFKKTNEGFPEGEQHLASHIIGDVLYESEGHNAITVCDSSFGFGCFHGLFGVALAREGMGAIKSLDASCVSRFGSLGTGCMHGIGHGVLEYIGYDHINKALSACNDTTQLVSILGCTSGVFMEYNTPLKEVGDGNLITVPRDFDSHNPYRPCNSVSSDFKQSCYFEMGQWWALSMGNDIGDWQQMAHLCSLLTEADFQFCMLGVGHALGIMSAYDLALVTSVCDSLDNAVRFYCRAGGHWALYANPTHRDNAVQLCNAVVDVEACTYWGRPDTWARE